VRYPRNPGPAARFDGLSGLLSSRSGLSSTPQARRWDFLLLLLIIGVVSRVELRVSSWLPPTHDDKTVMNGAPRFCEWATRPSPLGSFLRANTHRLNLAFLCQTSRFFDRIEFWRATGRMRANCGTKAYPLETGHLYASV
jgi:hypothetical protein